MVTRIYRGAVFILLLVILLPGYPRALVLGRVVNVQAWASVLLLFLLGGHFAIRHGKSVYILFLLALFLWAGLLGYVNGGDLRFARNHAFAFAPFIIAFLLLELDVGTSFRTALFWLTLCGAVGAIAANAIHVFHPELLGILLKDEDKATGIINLGRVGWAGYIVTLPVIAQLGFLDMYSRRQRLIMLTCIPIVLAGALLTFSRTLTVALVVLLAYLLYANRRKLGLKGAAMLGLLGLAGSYFIAWWETINPALIDLINNRIVSFFSGSSDISTDVSGRMILYGEYLERLKSSYMLGQGIGVPVSTAFGDATWADVTLVTFAVPFGVFGLALFVLFLKRLYARITTTIDDQRVRRLFTLVFVLGLAISLNDDIWSHKFFVVYLVFLVNSYRLERVATGWRTGSDGTRRRLLGSYALHHQHASRAAGAGRSGVIARDGDSNPS